MLTNLVRELDDHDLSVLHTRNTQNGLVGEACVNPLHKKISPPGGLRCSTLLQLDNSWLAIWSAVTVVTTGGETLSAPRRRMIGHAFLLFMVRLVFSTMSLQILRLSSEMSSSKVSPSWIVDSENGSLLYSSS